MRTFVSAGLCLGALVLPFAASTPAHAADSLRGTTWYLSAPGATGELSASFRIAVDGSLTVDSTCNQVSAQGIVRAGSFTIDFPWLATTRMACEGPAGTIESTLLKSLDKALYYRISDGKLVLTDASGAETTYTSTPAAASSSMTDVVWRLKTDRVADDVAARASFQVKADGTMYVSSPCNRVGAADKAVISGSSITFPLLNATRMGCDGDVMTAENMLFSALQGTATWSVSGDTLTLRAANGTVTTFVR